MFGLQMRMFLLLAALFAVIYATFVMIGTAAGVTDFSFYFVLSLGMMFVQYLIGPKMVEWTMQVRYVAKNEYPELFTMVEEMARRAHIPVPKICVSSLTIPNAFAFGRGRSDGRVCVTQGIMQLLNKEELKAVLGHELAHIRNRDVLTITLLSVIPMVMYRIAWHFMFYGNRRSRDGNSTALVGFIAFIFYFITNLLVLYGSRIREYYADRGSVEFGNQPSALASALYKLVYGSARMDKGLLKEAEGLKAFFINDPSRAYQEIRELAQLDLDRSGTIDPVELQSLRSKTIRLSSADRLMELLGTHPNMLRRIQHLSQQAI